MRYHRPALLLLALTVPCLALVSPAYAQPPPPPGGGFILTPNGNPTGPSSASESYWYGTYTVSLSPGQANTLQLWPNNITLSDVLGAQGFTAANGWTINRFNVQGNVTLNAYLAWTETAPAYTSPSGLINYAAAAHPGAGGAELGLTYNPQGADPSGADVHWLQIISTNAPDPNYPHGTAQDGSGLTYYVDDGPVANPTASGPWYDLTGAANSTDFFDAPARTYAGSTQWLGMVFIGTWDLNNETIDISNQAVVWGFTDPLTPAATVPEPSSLLAWCPVVVVLLGLCLRRSRIGTACSLPAASRLARYCGVKMPRVPAPI